MFHHLLTPLLFFLPRLSKKLSDRAIYSRALGAGFSPLPQLIGSPKQIPWAERLRDQFIRAAAPRGTAVEVLARFHRENSVYQAWIEEHPRRSLDLARACVRAVARTPFAWFWIDARPINHIALISSDLVDRIHFLEYLP